MANGFGNRSWVGLLVTAALVPLTPFPATALEFVPRELFRIPFTPDREGLGARIEKAQFSFPRDFTLDESGRFYIYDTKKHRVARFSPVGTYEMGFNYPPTAQRIFAHADQQDNLWLLVSDPTRGVYYGVYDARGKRLRDGIFSQFDNFRLHLGDEYALRVIFSSTKNTRPGQVFFFDEASHLLKKENIPPPPPDHHQVQQSDKLYYIDALPGQSSPVSRVTDSSKRVVSDMKGSVIYMTSQNEIYTRVSACEIRVYSIEGALLGKANLTGLPSSCEAIRFGSHGDIYQLDGIPDASGHYSEGMTGMRMVIWERR